MTVEHVYRPRTALSVWLAVVVCLGIGLGVWYLLGARFGLIVAAGAGVALAGRPFAVRLERDAAGSAYLAAGRWRERVWLDLGRLTHVELHAAGYLLRDAGGTVLVAPLDERLRDEVSSAAARQGLVLSRETDVTGRLVARCLRIPERIVVRGTGDVDRLDVRGGAAPAAIAAGVAARRALSFAPRPLPPRPRRADGS